MHNEREPAGRGAVVTGAGCNLSIGGVCFG
jgi:hypothetical protein